MTKKVAIVTGASRGIGRSIFDLFTAKGYITFGTSKSTIEKNIEPCDIRDEVNVQKFIQSKIDEFKKVDILVNNAGIVNTREVIELELDAWNDVIATNLTGAFLSIKHALPSMVENGFGRIINISSVAGRFRSKTASVAYTASKYGLNGITKQLAAKYAKYGITINSLCPSQTETEMLMSNNSSEVLEDLRQHLPSERFAKPEEIAEMAYFLTTDKASYINGAMIDINGGIF